MRVRASYVRMTQKDPLKVKAGLARSKALSPDERKQAASAAAVARWNPGIQTASHDGEIKIGEMTIPCAVLEGGTRVLAQAGFLRALGRSRSPKAGTGVLSTVDGIPFFLQAEVLKPFINDDLIASTTPIFYCDKSGKKSVGYNAEALPQVAEVYLKLRDSAANAGRPIPKQHEHIIWACDTVIRGLARVGIVALVDEATGYQEVRDKHALQAILDKYLRKELAAWAKRFPDDFYKEIFRLRDWQWTGIKVQKPQCIGNFTNDIVYDRLAPHILKELELKNPKNENGNRRSKHHQWLTDDVGHPALAQHLFGVIALMRASSTWDQFYRMLQRSLPKKNETLPMDLGTA